jgi:hypothetical protein
VLFAVPFDTRRLVVTGTPVPVIEGVARIGNAVPFDVSPAGTLVFMPGPAAISGAQTDLAFIGEGGASSPLKLPAASYQEPRLSPGWQADRVYQRRRSRRCRMDLRTQRNDGAAAAHCPRAQPFSHVVGAWRPCRVSIRSRRRRRDLLAAS